MIYEDLAVAYEHITCCGRKLQLNLYKYYRKTRVSSLLLIAIGSWISTRPWNGTEPMSSETHPDDPEMKKRSIPAMSLMAWHVVHAKANSHI